MFKSGIVILAILLALSHSGLAKAAPLITGNSFATQTSGQPVVGVTIMCINGSNVAVPALTTGQCLGSGGGGGSTPPVGAANFAPAQVSVASTATLIVAARTGAAGTGRVAATVTNTTNTAVYLGGSGVTTSTGQLLPAGAGSSVTINTTAAIYGIVATGTATVTEFETY